MILFCYFLFDTQSSILVKKCLFYSCHFHHRPFLVVSVGFLLPFRFISCEFLRCHKCIVAFQLQTMEDALQVRQNNISQLNEMYFKLSDECKRREVLMPEPVSEKVETLNDDWLKIQELAATLRPLSDTSMEHNYLEGLHLIRSCGMFVEKTNYCCFGLDSCHIIIIIIIIMTLLRVFQCLGLVVMVIS